jgi:type I restriction enzyme, S subunit
MSEWKEYKLKDVIEKFIDYRGKTPKKTTEGIPLITAKIVKKGRIETPNEFIHPDDYEGWMTRGFPKINDVVMTTEAPLGEVALIKDDSWALAQRVITMRGNPDLCDNIFLKYYLQSKEGQGALQARASGSTVEGIKSSELREMEISLPNIELQESIGEILISLDNKIDLLHRQNQTLEAMAETLFRQWFIEEAEENWEKGKLGDYMTIKHGYAFKGDFITPEETDKILVTPGNFKVGGGFSFHKFKYYTDNGFPESYILNEGDFIVTMTDLSISNDSLGYPAFVPAIADKFLLHNQRVGKVLIKKGDESKSLFLYYLMKTSDYRHYILGSCTGTNVSHTSPSIICEYEFNVPDDGKIISFKNQVQSLQAKQQSNIRQIQTLTQLRDTLLPKLMSGEVRVT